LLRLEGQAQLQPDESTVIDSLLIEARINSSEICIRFNVRDREQSARCLIYINEKRTEIREVLISRRTKRVIKDIVKVGTHF
jgi:hypothetical protein